MYVYSFERLDVWKDSKQLVILTFKSTNQFPDMEKFGLVSQIRRAAVSIPSNIAEGSARRTHKEKAHYITIAFGSAVELLNQLIISFELKYLSLEEYKILRAQIEKVTNKLNALRNSFTK